MKSLSIPDRVIRIVGFIIGGVGLILLLFSFLSEITSPDSHESLLFLVIAYYSLVFAIAVIDTTVYGNKRGFKDLSMPSFYLFTLFLPGAIDIIILCILAKIISMPLGLVSIICWASHILMLGVWFIPKLKSLRKLKDSDIMKLDFYSSLVLIPLTVVWVIYRIESFKFGFAVMMFELMVIQAFIKIELITRKALQEKIDELASVKEPDKIEETQ